METQIRREHISKANTLDKEYKVNFYETLLLKRRLNREVKEIEKAFEFKFNKTEKPKLVAAYEIPGNSTIAQTYKGNVIIYRISLALKSETTIPHEVYHHLQDVSRKKIDKNDNETKYILENGSSQSEVDRAYTLWNGTNEAGAYIAGNLLPLSKRYSGNNLVQRIMESIERDHNIRVKNVEEDFINLLFNRSSEYKINSEIGRLNATVGVAAVVLSMKELNVYETAKELLKSPDQTIEKLKSEGEKNIRHHFKRMEELLRE